MILTDRMNDYLVLFSTQRLIDLTKTEQFMDKGRALPSRPLILFKRLDADGGQCLRTDGGRWVGDAHPTNNDAEPPNRLNTHCQHALDRREGSDAGGFGQDNFGRSVFHRQI